MSIEQALIAQAQPFMVGARLRSIIQAEITKGCNPEISRKAVSLEPYFKPLGAIDSRPETGETPHWIYEVPPQSEALIRLQVWISPEYNFDWNRSELFNKQLQAVSLRVGFEVAGNGAGILLCFLIHRTDFPIISAAFNGEFDLCELTTLERSPLGILKDKNSGDVVFRDYFPPPPYSHLLTRPPELHVSPLIPLMTALSTIEPPALGIYQALLQPVPPNHNWHRNVELLLDIEYTIKLHSELRSPQRYTQQAPSGDLHHMAFEVESKANNDKAFYATALRIAIVDAGTKARDLLSSLSTFVSLFQHGGRPLGYLTETEYSGILSPAQIREMFLAGLTYRPGFMLNSLELTGLIHIPSLPTNEYSPLPIACLETLAVRNSELFAGTWIGTCINAGVSQKVCVPRVIRRRHTRFIGGSGSGKSTTEEHMILDDIEKGYGVAVLDPHGDMVERLLCLIPEQYVEKTIYFNPADPDWIPLWNPLDRIPGQEIGRTANDLVTAIKSFVESGGWGDRLENILRNVIFGLLHVPGTTFLDISRLLRNKSKTNELLIQQILKVVDNQTGRQFWLHDYGGYGKNDLSPPINKLSKLLISGPISLMLSQPENRFDFRKIMDQGDILLINLTNMGVTVRQVLGCFILSSLHLSALSRSDIPIDDRKQFHIYCDEAHNFLTDSLENLIAETRKFRVSLSIAHQYQSQFNSKKKRDALSTVGTSIIYKVDKRDADYLAKDLQGKVSAEDLVSLGVGEAVARIGTDIVKIKTRPPLEIPDSHFRDRIIENSRRSYCKPAHEVRKWITNAGNGWIEPYAPLNAAVPESSKNENEDFGYDEF
ncbi:MAG: type IV secretion system DNA-binding domain-containing protein [Deltaproteobacteria bacterium]|nr:type IV secretion system DNA-binding domain-containing protein [Deltaproteobacteria bacterium]